MARPKLLDLYCGAGGASEGYRRAGFDVTGVDIKPQPRYKSGRFVQADSLEYAAEHYQEYQAIAGSPPCQAHTKLKFIWDRTYEDYIGATRTL